MVCSMIIVQFSLLIVDLVQKSPSGIYENADCSALNVFHLPRLLPWLCRSLPSSPPLISAFFVTARKFEAEGRKRPWLQGYNGFLPGSRCRLCNLFRVNIGLCFPGLPDASKFTDGHTATKMQVLPIVIQNPSPATLLDLEFWHCRHSVPS